MLASDRNIFCTFPHLTISYLLLCFKMSFKLDLCQISEDPQLALQYVVETLLSTIYPATLRIRNKLKSLSEETQFEELVRIQEAYSLSGSQIRKIILNLLEIFKVEYQQQIVLQETRQFALERLSWCINQLIFIEQHLEKLHIENLNESVESILVTPMYFVNWIDHTFEVLAKLANVIYRTDYKDSDQLYNQWRKDVVEYVTGLHTCVDELLLSAMTLCKHCLPSDQLIVKARCQVVLRETKALLTELISENPDSTFTVTPETLKLPLMPSNVNVLIDVLKDVLYVLETNTNTALLALLVHCFSFSKFPVDLVKEHFVKSAKGRCCCVGEGDTLEECEVVKEFDAYNERLMQIGSFAVSCSSDQNRIMSLRSGLSSLEALDPHLVPAVMMAPSTAHTDLLTHTWRQEVEEIRDNVYLIVDPAAFAEKAKQMMHQILLEVLKAKSYDNNSICAIINTGCIVHNFFCVYNKYEPDALTLHDKLVPLLADLDKVQTECKIVSNILSSGEDFVYEVKYMKNKNASLDQLLKRLKLLYTLVTRINDLLHPKDNEDELFAYECDDESVVNNITHTIIRIDPNTYISKPVNISRSTFARTSNLRSSTNNFSLSKLTKHFKAKRERCDELSFSVKLDELTDSVCDKVETKSCDNKNITHVLEPSIFYAFSPVKARSSLRRTVLNSKLTYAKGVDNRLLPNNTISEKESLMDETTSLQITDVLNEINDLTHVMSTSKFSQNITRRISEETQKVSKEEKPKRNVLTLNINNQNTTISKHIWNIPINASSVEMALDENVSPNSSNMTQPSNVTTLERISDLDLVESKLSSLRSMQFETSL